MYLSLSIILSPYFNGIFVSGGLKSCPLHYGYRELPRKVRSWGEIEMILGAEEDFQMFFCGDVWRGMKNLFYEIYFTMDV